MAARDQLQRMLDRKRAEIAELRSSLTAAEAYAEALTDAIKLLPRDSEAEPEPRALRMGSKLFKAQDLLRQHGSPMHIVHILQGIGEENTKDTRLALTGSLAGYARQGRIFTKTGPNVFGLLEFSSKPLSQDEDVQEAEKFYVPSGPEVAEDDIPF